ncbi:NocE [Streptomyces sparsogenes]|uniref:golvesin C-terminal-like domain-containing protein n=1 Tax=Streptomyces sparsogenes TaxID=67365 RepID=UPI0033D30AB7
MRVFRKKRPIGYAAVLMAAVMALCAGQPGAAVGAQAAEDGKAGDKTVSGDADPTPDRSPATAIAPEDRASVLGAGWRKSADRAWVTSGDADGFHLLVADRKSGYQWRTAASLAEPGLESDLWIGNACVTASGKRAVVAYAPRTFTNKPELMARGAFTAVVDLETGDVTKLNRQASLAYFSPGCGTGETAVLTQLGGEDKNATRLVEVDAATGRLAKPIELKGQVTSAVPVGGDLVAADSARLIRIDRKTGERREIARTDQVPFLLQPDADGGVVYMDRPTGEARQGVARKGEVERVTATDISSAGKKRRTRATVLARGPLAKMDLSRSADGTVFITGETDGAGKLPGVVKRRPDAPKDTVASTRGEALVTKAEWADGKDSRIRPEEALTARTVEVRLKTLGTGRAAEFEVPPGVSATEKAAEGRVSSPGFRAVPADERRSGARSTGSPSDPVEDERYCSVPRNNPRKMAMQPKPRQVEWAVDQAITNNLNKHIYREADWKRLGMEGYQPQTLFPRTPLEGGGRIPAQVMLGVTAQESNMWQAARMAVPGVTANPLIGNFYGIGYEDDGEQSDPWRIDWAEADCGYGVTQVTDGMRMKGREKEGETALSPLQQEAVALDYTANIAAGINILIDKWNATRKDGLVINNGDPKWVENWFYALWAYNTGYYPKASAAQHGGRWGVGFTNNPANPLWKANRLPFLEDAAGNDNYRDAAHPQDWPYQEKVLGWAARPLEALESPGKMVSGFRAAWWNSSSARTGIKPAQDLFCTSANECDPSLIGPDDKNDPGLGACNREDLECWWHQPVTWKDCGPAKTECGNELLRFNATDYPEQDDGTAYEPACTDEGLPEGALVVDDLPSRSAPTRPNCGSRPSYGTFTFDFAGSDGLYPSKMDTHQLGAGYSAHFYFSHTRPDGVNGKRLQVTGTWTLGEQIDGWSRVLVHMPDNGAHTRQAKYVIDTGNGTKTRVAQQRTRENRWVSLGAFKFSGTPKVSLSTLTLDGTGDEDVAWDAVAFQKLPGKPKNFVVAMGDSYSSGEGASVTGGGDYYPETDVMGDNPQLRNACHRSTKTWSRRAALADSPAKSIGDRADAWDPSMDYHLIACSGAKVKHVLPDEPGVELRDKWQYGELPQLDQGYLDENTTLVTISIGGNDARFSSIISKCIFGGIGVPDECQDETLGDDSGPLKEVQPEYMRTKVKPEIVKALKAISSAAPHAKIVLMGYPILLEGSGSCVPGIGSAEAPWLNEMGEIMLDVMDDATAEARAAGVDVRFSNPKKYFAGKGVCGDPESIHGIVFDKTPGDDPELKKPSNQSFHPKTGGAELYADSLEDTLRAMGL